MEVRYSTKMPWFQKDKAISNSGMCIHTGAEVPYVPPQETLTRHKGSHNGSTSGQQDGWFAFLDTGCCDKHS